HEFLGSMAYAVEGKIKIVQFWLMRASGLPTGELMDDVKAVKWLPLKQAVETLSRPHERVFLTHVGPIALAHVKKTLRGKKRSTRGNGKGRHVAPAPVEHVIAMDANTRPNLFVRALGRWTGLGTQAAARKAG
ncbi:MAG TPA: hypothetical protein VGH13_21265, partial [Xanthobacteraceae bacterium]